MAKSKARLVTASEEVKGLVDRGYEVDVELKNLGFEDKGIKKMLTDKLAEEFEEGSSIRVEGSEGAAVVTQTERYSIDNAEVVPEIRKAVEAGLLGDAVKVEQTLNVPVADREKAVELLKQAGINATTSVKVSVNTTEFRALTGSENESVEQMEAKALLKGAVERAVSYRVKYEKV